MLVSIIDTSMDTCMDHQLKMESSIIDDSNAIILLAIIAGWISTCFVVYPLIANSGFPYNCVLLYIVHYRTFIVMYNSF